jgi:uncharacterized phiE125 gp8 family phage protein
VSLNFRLITPPTVEPVSLDLAKQHCRVDFTDDDALFTLYISAAREYCEKFMNRSIFNQTYVLYLDSFPYGDWRSTTPMDQRSPYNYSSYWSDMAIRLPRPSAVSVTSIKYLDASGVQQTLSQSYYYTDVTSEPGRIVPSAGTTWPTTQYYQPGSIQVTYISGTWGDGTVINTCPQSIVRAMLLLISHYYDRRGSASESTVKTIPQAVDASLNQYAFEVFGNYTSGY